MRDRNQKQRRHIRAAREWLGEAEHSLAENHRVRGELKVMLAKAELARVEGTPGTACLRSGRRGCCLHVQLFSSPRAAGGSCADRHRPFPLRTLRRLPYRNPHRNRRRRRQRPRPCKAVHRFMMMHLCRKRKPRQQSLYIRRCSRYRKALCQMPYLLSSRCSPKRQQRLLSLRRQKSRMTGCRN